MPGQFEGILDKLQTKLGKQTIKRASTINRPRPKLNVIQIKAINDFVKRNPRADGGSVNGSYEAALRKKVEELMDDGYEFGEAVREAMRQGYAKAGLVDPDNNIKKGQDLGRGIAQRLKYTNQEGKKIIRYVTSGIKDTPIKEHKKFKEAQNYRNKLIEKYGDPKELGKYQGKFNYKELTKDSDFEDFWKTKVDGSKKSYSLTEKSKSTGEKNVEDAIQKVVKKYKLKSNDYENIFNKVLEETRISQAIRKGTTAGKGKTQLISSALIENLIDTFNKSIKPYVGTIDTNEMEKLLKLPKGQLSKLMNLMDVDVEKQDRFTGQKSRAGKAAILKDKLKKEGITFSRLQRNPDKKGTRYRFKISKDKIKQLEKSKTFPFKKEIKASNYSPKLKDTYSVLSRNSPEYKKYGYGRDRNIIVKLNNALNNGLRAMSDKELIKFVDKNPIIKNLVTSYFDPKDATVKNYNLKKMPIDLIRQNAAFEIDHIRGRSTVDFDSSTKKILSGLDIEYPKNLYIIPKALNMSTKQRVENYVYNNPGEKKKIKNLDEYFKKNKLTYYDINNAKYKGYKPSASALDLSHLGITKISELEKLISGTFVDNKGKTRVKTKDPQKLIATVNEINKARGGVSLEDDIITVKKHVGSQGVKFNSFAGFMDFAQTAKDLNIELPPAVKQAVARIVRTGGQILKGTGVGAAVLDPMFAAYDFSTAIDKGVGGKEAAKYTGKRFVEGVLNLPDLVASGAKFAKDKIQGEDAKFKTGTLYEPFTFAQESLDRAEAATPKSTRLRNIVERDFDVGQGATMRMVDDMEIPASKTEIDTAKEKFVESQMGPYYKYGLESMVEEEPEEKPLQNEGLLDILTNPTYKGGVIKT